MQPNTVLNCKNDEIHKIFHLSKLLANHQTDEKNYRQHFLMSYLSRITFIFGNQKMLSYYLILKTIWNDESYIKVSIHLKHLSWGRLYLCSLFSHVFYRQLFISKILLTLERVQLNSKTKFIVLFKFAYRNDFTNLLLIWYKYIVTWIVSYMVTESTWAKGFTWLLGSWDGCCWVFSFYYYYWANTQ